MSVNFKKTSRTFGDETSNYDVTSDSKTAKDFVNKVLTSFKGEWGYFHLGGKRYEYRYGVLLNNIPDEVLNREIVYPIKANGGWSAMDYRINIK